MQPIHVSIVFVFFRCYADELANKTIPEIREIYSTYADPSCSVYKGNRTAVEGSLLLSSPHDLDRANDPSEKCQRWIYELDYGYQSMSAEVGSVGFQSVFSPFH